jgi:hypothetical protein
MQDPEVKKKERKNNENHFNPLTLSGTGIWQENML